MRLYLLFLLVCGLAAGGGWGCGHSELLSPSSAVDAPAKANISSYQQHRHAGSKPATLPGTTR